MKEEKVIASIVVFKAIEVFDAIKKFWHLEFQCKCGVQFPTLVGLINHWKFEHEQNTQRWSNLREELLVNANELLRLNSLINWDINLDHIVLFCPACLRFLDREGKNAKEIGKGYAVLKCEQCNQSRRIGSEIDLTKFFGHDVISDSILKNKHKEILGK